MKNQTIRYLSFPTLQKRTGIAMVAFTLVDVGINLKLANVRHRESFCHEEV